jgi:protein O-mannosyl-transferase
VAERKEVLSGFFWFAVLWCYAVYAERRRDGDARAWRFYALALVAFALGLMAKPMLVTLPCVLLLLDVWPLRRVGWVEVGSGRASLPVERASFETARPEVGPYLLLEKLPFFALAAASSVATFYVQQAGGSVTEALGFGARLENAVVAVVRYLGKFVWPFDLAVLYPHPGDWPARKVIACLVIVVALSAVAWRQRRRRLWIPVGWLWFLGTLVPVIGLVQVGMQSMADRYTYLPILGVQIALLWTLRDVFTSAPARRAGALVGAVVLLGCVARTWNQLGVWRNSDTLFSHAIAVTKDNFVAHDNRGLYRFERGRVDEAIADYRQALAINPRYMNPNNNLGHALAQLGRPAEALPYYRTAMAAKPDHLEVRNNLANALSDLGQLDEAMTHYDFVLARQPDHANALNGSAVVLAMRGQPAAARARLEHALRVTPNYPGAHNNLGNVCSMLGQWEDAARHYRRAADLQPDAATFAHLGHALSNLGRKEEAVRALREALRLQPQHAQAKAWLQAIEQK